MEQVTDSRKVIMEEYHQAVKPLLAYLPWFERNSGQSTFTVYGGEGIGDNSLSFPVYDGELLRFVKQAEKSSLMERNYRYVYSRNRLNDHDAERDFIEKASWRDWNNLKGILSKYVLGGRTKAPLWNEAVQEDIFYLVLKKMKELGEFWEKQVEL